MAYMRSSAGRRLDSFDVAERDTVDRLIPIKNLIPSPITTTLGNWYASGSGTGGTSTTEVLATGGYKGRPGFRQTWTVAPTSGGLGMGTRFTDSNFRATVIAGSICAGSIWVYLEGAALVQMQLRILGLNSSGTVVQTIIGTSKQIVANKWRRLVLTAAESFRSDVVYAAVQAYVPTASQIGNTGAITISAPHLEQDTSVGPYRDGTFIDARWSGSTNLSPTLASVGTTERYAAWGDSHIGQADGGGYALQHHIEDYLDREVYFGGRGGETITGIGIRQGGVKAYVTFASNTIAGTSPTSVTSVTTDPVGFLRTTGTWGFRGYFLAADGTTRVGGVLSLIENVWTFTRDFDGSNITMSPASRFYSTAEQTKADLVILQGGNNVDTTTGTARPTAAEAVEAFKAMAARCRELGQDYIILSAYNNATEPSGSTGYIRTLAINAGLAAAEPGNYYDLRTYLVRNGLAAAWITPTSDDVTALAEDRLPPSLQADAIHLSNQGRRVAASYIRQVIIRRGKLFPLST